jgi:hypothetical protein
MQHYSPEKETIYARELARVWKKAAAELGIEVVAPFQLNVDGRLITYPVLVRNFGRPNGVLPIMIGSANQDQLVRAGMRMGYFCSLMNAWPGDPIRCGVVQRYLR